MRKMYSIFATVSQRIQHRVQNVKGNSSRRCFGNHQYSCIWVHLLVYLQLERTIWSVNYSFKQELPTIAAGEGQYSMVEFKFWSTVDRLYPVLIELEDTHIDHFTIKINWRVKPVEWFNYLALGYIIGNNWYRSFNNHHICLQKSSKTFD